MVGIQKPHTLSRFWPQLETVGVFCFIYLYTLKNQPQMKLGNIIRLFVVFIVVGGFGGWIWAFASGQGNEGQSTGTGYGCLAGLVLFIIILALAWLTDLLERRKQAKNGRS